MDSEIQNETESGVDQVKLHEEYLQRFGQLAERWRAQREADLDLRRETGDVLNERIGPPTERQKRGAQVLKDAAKELGTTQSELSRMRWFAHLFPSLDDLRQHHQAVTTWTSVKELLPKLMPQGQAKAQSRKGTVKNTKRKSRKATKLREIKQCLVKLVSNLKKLPPELTDEEKQSVLDKLKEVAQVVNEHLKIEVPSYQMPAEAAPLAA
jgi:hypothetical protein